MDIPPLPPPRLVVMGKSSPSTTDNGLLRHGYLAELGRRLEVRISPRAWDYPGPGGRPSFHPSLPRRDRERIRPPSPPQCKLQGPCRRPWEAVSVRHGHSAPRDPSVSPCLAPQHRSAPLCAAPRSGISAGPPPLLRREKARYGHRPGGEAPLPYLSIHPFIHPSVACFSISRT